MSSRLAALRAELPPMARLATPVVVAELGWIAMGVVDIAMVGRLGPEAIGAVGVGSVVFFAIAVFGIGVLLGLDTLVAQAYGAHRLDECHRWLFHGVGLSLLLAVPLTGVTALVVALLDRWGLEPAVEVLVGPYFSTLLWSILPLLLYAAFRRYLQAMGLVAPVMMALLSANLINVAANWVLIFGNLGAPRLGVQGAAWATCGARVYLALFLLFAILRHDRLHRTGLWHAPRRLDLVRLRRLAGLGVPAAVQVTLEVGVFAAATALAGRLDAATLAAHQIVLSVASVTFMVPLGVGAAGAVRVGHAVGRGDPAGARDAGGAALVIGTGFMACAGVVFILAPSAILRLFTADVAVLAIGVPLVFVAALFQLFDGLQGVATGVLRGLGDTRTPMVWNLAGHWVIGLPLGYVLCFERGWGALGLWSGLCLGLMVVGCVLVVTWSRRTAAWTLTR
ncbi:MAG: MATE family efflux transporter [Acidobacteria bacterium]|nr:MATE family efflux transporter [Acidobacteriota bacterium]